MSTWVEQPHTDILHYTAEALDLAEGELCITNVMILRQDLVFSHAGMLLFFGPMLVFFNL